jgi:hypothetical protein
LNVRKGIDDRFWQGDLILGCFFGKHTSLPPYNKDTLLFLNSQQEFPKVLKAKSKDEHRVKMSQSRPTESPFGENGTADPFLLGRISGRIEGQDLRILLHQIQ